MTVGFLCSMLRDDLSVFLERTGEHTIYTKAGDLLENDMIVKDFRFMPSDAIIIVGRGTNNG